MGRKVEMSADDQLQPHEQRVVAEHAELAERLGKLQVFTASDACKALGHRRESMLLRQQEVMTTYLGVLAERIDDFDRPGDQMVVYSKKITNDTSPLEGVPTMIAVRLDRFKGFTMDCDKSTATVVRRDNLPPGVALR